MKETTYPSRRLFVLVMLGCLTGVERVDSQEGKASGGSPSIALRTVYLQEPIGRAHQISIRGDFSGAGRVVLDGNACTITQFGDPGVCTKVAFPPIDVEIVRVRLADPSGLGRRIYALHGELQPAGAKFFLVIPRRRSQPHRLVVNLANDSRRVVTLEAIPDLPAQPKPKLCSSASYEAVQRNGKVTVIGQGQHSTGGWKVAFEQLPIRIFPPQYRLVCVSPSGVVTQAVTPFRAETTFNADQPVSEVTVHDDGGAHKIKVRQQE